MKKSQGFTLIEILVVIAITIILLGFSLSTYLGVQKTSRDNKRKSDLIMIGSALEIYRSDCQTYPADWNLSGQPGEVELFGCPPDDDISYMSSVPKDPGVFSYKYIQGSANSYCLCARLEIMTDPGSGCDCGECADGIDCNYSVSNP